MQNIYSNRKGKQRKSSVRRGARKELDQKEQKRLLLLGIEPCTKIRPVETHIWSYGYGTGGQCHIRYRIYNVPRIRRIYGHTV